MPWEDQTHTQVAQYKLHLILSLAGPQGTHISLTQIILHHSSGKVPVMLALLVATVLQGGRV